MEFPLLNSKNLSYNELTYIDIENIIKAYSNKNNIVYFDNKTLNNTKTSKEYIDFWNERYKKKKGVRWALYSNKNEFIGLVGFNYFNKHYGTIAVLILEEYWGMGFATESIKEMLKFGFEKLKLNRIEADHYESNPVSGVVLKKNNFKQEGIIREKRFQNNKYHNVIVYGLLKKEWERAN